MALPAGGKQRDSMSGQAVGIAQAITEVARGIFRIVVPVPIPEVGFMNSYAVVGGERTLIVDPGMSHPECCEAMANAMEVLGIDLGRTDFFITHHHLDHFGAVSRFLSRTSRIYIGRLEAEFIAKVASGEVEAEMGEFLEMLGFPDKDPGNLISKFYGDEFRLQRPWPFVHLDDGDVMVRGGYNFACVIAPGHTIGHCCLYETGAGILISGDQITAGVQFLRDRVNPLADHFLSLDRLRAMDVSLTLPGHGSPHGDHRKRIDQLRAHHQGRVEAVYGALSEDGKDAYEVTVALDGLLPDRDPLDALSSAMRFIHTRHSFAYLQYLTAQGSAKRQYSRGRVLFSRRQSL